MDKRQDRVIREWRDTFKVYFFKAFYLKLGEMHLDIFFIFTGFLCT